MNKEVDIFVARLLMIDRLQHKLADVTFQIRLEKEADASINNQRLSNLNVLHGVLDREINQLIELNEEDRNTMYFDIVQ